MNQRSAASHAVSASHLSKRSVGIAARQQTEVKKTEYTVLHQLRLKMQRRMQDTLAVAPMSITLALGFFAAPVALAIQGGYEAYPGQFPFMAQTNSYTSNTNSHTCGGVLVAPKWVLTAAHCHQNSATSQQSVVLGAHTEKRTDSSEPRQSIPVVRKVVHPSGLYGGWGSGKPDLLMLELQYPATLNDRVQTIPLNYDINFGRNGTTTTIGWGATCAGCAYAQRLTAVDLPIAFGTTDGIIAGVQSSYQSVCYSDSGGPWIKNGVLIGITSTTFASCTGQSGAADVALYSSWITGVINGSGTGQFPPAISVGTASANEGNGVVSVPVTLSEYYNQQVSVKLATGSGSAGNGDFYGTFQTLTFSPGETSKTVSISINDDSLVENTEQFTARIFDAVGADIYISEAAISIFDNDAAAPPTGDFNPAGFALVSQTVNEAAGQATVRVNLSRALSSEASVKFATQADTATANQDFYGTYRLLRFGPGETSKLISFPIIDDGLSEDDERVKLRLFDGNGAIVSAARATLTIEDNDGGGSGGSSGGGSSSGGSSSGGSSSGGNSTPTASVRWASVSESDGVVNVPVTLSTAPGQTVSVTLETVDASAVNGSDYYRMVQVLTFGPGSTRVNATIGLVNDQNAEPTEYFTVRLSNPNGVRLGDSQVSITILNDD